MSGSADSFGEEEETLPTFAEAKEEFEYWVELYTDNLRDWPKEYRFKYKRGREPDDIIRQYNEQVKPGFERHIAPYRDQADFRLDALPSDLESFIKKTLKLTR